MFELMKKYFSFTTNFFFISPLRSLSIQDYSKNKTFPSLLTFLLKVKHRRVCLILFVALVSLRTERAPPRTFLFLSLLGRGVGWKGKKRWLENKKIDEKFNENFFREVWQCRERPLNFFSAKGWKFPSIISKSSRHFGSFVSWLLWGYKKCFLNSSSTATCNQFQSVARLQNVCVYIARLSKIHSDARINSFVCVCFTSFSI